MWHGSIACERIANVTWLVCTTCGTHNMDPGGPQESYLCGNCGHQTLVRVQPPPPQNTSDGTVAGAAIGGTLGGLFFGPYGALIGAVLGGAIGKKAQT